MNTNTMRATFRTLALTTGFAAFLGSHAQTLNVAVNSTGAANDPSAILDVQSDYTGVGARQKGFLMPRMTQAQRDAIAAPADGLTIYQTDNNPGFYYRDGAAWVRLSPGKPGWQLQGNDLTDPNADWLGTTDANPIIFSTFNEEHMRVRADGRVSIQQPNPLEILDVGGAIRLTGTSIGNDIGTIRWSLPDSVHQGYMGPALGWRAMENFYNVVKNVPYTQQAQTSCGAGTSKIPSNIAVVTSNNLIMTPFPNANNVNRARKQYLFLPNELNVELAQISGTTTATQGLCPGQPINSISFYRGAGGVAKLWQMQVNVYHVPPQITNLSAGFVPNNDPAYACYGSAGITINPGPGIITFNLNSNFVWDGVRPVVVEVVTSNTGGSAGGQLPVEYFTVPGVAPANQLTYGWNATSTLGSCSNTNLACGGINPTGSGLPNDGSCPGLAGAFGSSNLRPVIGFGGTVSTAVGPAVSGNGDYMEFQGGLLVESTPNWRAQTIPYYAFKGPGSIHAELGVYDNGVRLNDHVFDRWYDGRVKPQDAPQAGTLVNLDIDAMSDFIAANRHLPTMKGRRDWEREGGFSFGDLTNQLWTTAETQALYLTELNRRAHFLEALATGRDLSGAELDQMRLEVLRMKDLSEGQKALLLNDLRTRCNGINETTR